MAQHLERICVPICVRRVRDLDSAIARACEVGDLVELRFDCVEPAELGEALELTRSLLSKLARPFVVTYRPAEEGGKCDLDRAARLKFWLFDRPREAAFYDIELDLVEGLAASDFGQHDVNWSAVICSHHDFAGVPADLEQIYERMTSTPARVLKIAVQGDEITDCIPVFDLLERARSEGREVIAIAMGAAGIATRVLGPSRGSFLTYGSLEAGDGTAPGQCTARELRDLYRINGIDRETKITGVVGLPVAHSISPHIHNAAFAAAKLNAVYLPLEVRDVSAFMQRMVHPHTRELDWNLCGLSVTAPHKSAVIQFLDWIEPAAREIGAVNTIVVSDGALHGYNTDAIAVLQPVIEKLGSLRDSRCAVIGAGGAASAILWSLRGAGAKAVLFARDEVKGRALAGKFGANCERLDDNVFAGFELVINATPLGTLGPLVDGTAATSDQLRGARLVYDLVYNPSETRFMREARAAGCDAIGGLRMLVLQAAEQFRLWSGTEPPVEVMCDAANRALARI